MNSNPSDNQFDISLPKVNDEGKLEGNRKQRRNFDRIKRKAKKALMKVGYKVKR